jgi:hypothetical protein
MRRYKSITDRRDADNWIKCRQAALVARHDLAHLGVEDRVGRDEGFRQTRAPALSGDVGNVPAAIAIDRRILEAEQATGYLAVTLVFQLRWTVPRLSLVEEAASSEWAINTLKSER